jgi:hypothetical protein
MTHPAFASCEEERCCGVLIKGTSEPGFPQRQPRSRPALDARRT